MVICHTEYFMSEEFEMPVPGPEEPPKEVKDEGQDLYATAESDKKLAELQAHEKMEETDVLSLGFELRKC